MASRKIKGITIEINGDTSKLGKALDATDKQARDLQSALKQVETALKFNPGNLELVAQKQELLSSKIQLTTKKLETLKKTSEQVEKQLEDGTIDTDTYQAFRREIIRTESQLRNYKKALDNTKKEQTQLKDNSKALFQIIQKEGKTIDDYADIIGDDLVEALKRGEGKSEDIAKAILKIVDPANKAKLKIRDVNKTLSNLDDGADLKNVQNEFEQVTSEAKNTTGAVNETKDSMLELNKGSGLANAVGGVLDGIAQVADKLQDVIDLTKEFTRTSITVDATIDLPEEERKIIKEVIRDVETYGVDASTALAGVRKQFQLNSKATTESNKGIVTSASAIAYAYSDIDFTELIQESNELSKTLGISQEDSMALVNHLLKIGFPTSQLDIMSEYGTQLANAGYSAEEVQAVFAAGIDTGSWNIDNLLDGIKEGRIRMSEFGAEVPQSLDGLLDKANISKTRFQELGKAIAGGGEDGKKAMQEVAQMLANVNDDTVRNKLGVEIYGTKWEDQGSNITDTLLNIGKHISSTDTMTEELADTVDTVNSDPMLEFNDAMTTMKETLTPVMGVLAKIIKGVAKFVKKYPIITAVIVGLITLATILIPFIAEIKLLMLAMPAAGAAMGSGMTAALGPIALIIAAIVAIIVIVVQVVKHWDKIKEKAIEIWGSISEFFEQLWEGIKGFFSETWDSIKETASEAWEGIKSFFSDTWNSIKDTASEAWEGVKGFFSDTWNSIKDTASETWDSVKTKVTDTWDSVKTTVSEGVGKVKDWVSDKWDNIKEKTQQVYTSIGETIMDKLGVSKEDVRKSLHAMKDEYDKHGGGVTGVMAGAYAGINSLTDGKLGEMVSAVSDKLDSIRQTFKNIMDRVKDIVGGAIQRVKDFFNFDWSLPHIKLPHFSIRGRFSLNPPQIPRLGVSWYDKGGIFNSPSIIGVGEKRPEFVGALDDLRKLIREETTPKTASIDYKLLGKAVCQAFIEANIKVVSNDRVMGELVEADRRRHAYGRGEL